MKRGIVISLAVIFILAVGAFFGARFYLQYVETGANIKFIAEDKKENSWEDTSISSSGNRLEISFKYPVPKDYFLEHLKVVPDIEGKVRFEEYNPSFLFRKAYFIPQNIEKGEVYKAKYFKKEFCFGVPLPQPREVSFNKENKEIVATFFSSIKEENFFKEFQTKPELKKGEYSFLDSNRKVIFKPNDIERGKKYKVQVMDKSLSFKVAPAQIEKFYFNKSKKQVVVKFDKPVKKERFFDNFEAPSLKGKFSFQHSGSKAVFSLNDIDKGKTYKVQALNKKIFFKVPKPKPKSPYEGKVIEIDLSRQRLKLHKEGKILASYLTSTGKPSMPTPTGEFKVLSKERNHWSADYGLYMPYSLRFHNGYFIHELPYWPGGYREGANHLGIPVSHGCVRLGIGAADNVYRFANIGTKVIIHK